MLISRQLPAFILSGAKFKTCSAECCSTAFTSKKCCTSKSCTNTVEFQGGTQQSGVAFPRGDFIRRDVVIAHRLHAAGPQRAAR